MINPKNKYKDTIFPIEVARIWIKMFSRLYKRGVSAAADLDDIGACKEYLEATAGVGVWGELTDERLSDDPIDWQVTLNVVSREIGAYTRVLNYFRNMGRYGSNYLSVAMIIALEWYRKGIEDYIAAPGAHNIAAFMDVERPLWGKKRIERMDYDRMIDVTQSIIRHRRIIDEESDNKRAALRDKHYIVFRQRISTASIGATYRYYG